MSFLSDIVEQHAEYESPSEFWYWAALTAISAVMKDNVYWDKFRYKLYPNIYVMFHADSGSRKGPPVNLAKNLAKGVGNVNVISGRASIQGILKKLSKVETKPGGKIVGGSNAFICSSELSSSIVDDKAAADILVDLYDRHYNEGDWESLLKSEVFALKDAIITMLSATNEAHSEEFFSRKDVQGGFFARTFIITAREFGNINSLMYAPRILPDDGKSIDYLRKIATLRGQFLIDDGAREYFDSWYNSFRNNIIKSKIKDATGTLNRFDDSVLKVAMLVALGSNEGELIVTRENIEVAISHCERLVGNVRSATLSAGKGELAAHTAKLLKELVGREPHRISREQLIRKYWMDGTEEVWNKVIQTLFQAGMVDLEPMGGTMLIIMKDSETERISEFLRGKDLI